MNDKITDEVLKEVSKSFFEEQKLIEAILLTQQKIIQNVVEIIDNLDNLEFMNVDGNTARKIIKEDLITKIQSQNSQQKYEPNNLDSRRGLKNTRSDIIGVGSRNEESVNILKKQTADTNIPLTNPTLDVVSRIDEECQEKKENNSSVDTDTISLLSRNSGANEMGVDNTTIGKKGATQKMDTHPDKNIHKKMGVKKE